VPGSGEIIEGRTGNPLLEPLLAGIPHKYYDGSRILIQGEVQGYGTFLE
jgi:hypothetical protein